MSDLILKQNVSGPIEEKNNNPPSKKESAPQVPITYNNPIPVQNKEEDKKKKGFMGMFKDIQKKIGGAIIGKEKEKEEERVIQPIQSKRDAYDRLQILQYKYKAKMSESDFNEFSMALSYLKDNE